MWYPSLPFISGFSFTIQILVLATVIPACYFKSTIRYGVLGLVGANYAIKILIPVSQWLFWIFQLVAWAGFYLFFFQRAVEYGFQGLGMMDNLQTGLGMMFGELEKLDRKRKSDDTPEPVKQEMKWPDIPPETEDVDEDDMSARMDMRGGYEEPELSDIGLGNVSDDDFQGGDMGGYDDRWRQS
ncbi:hypothetical protein BDN72DRAFT_849906 [Pluteus cervinus]|uniref:Uncharacterized protein n=1 Tax=Pluteus cervinus TaxID=181527 RepID=A0ACD3A6A8_9AGAR|nr:hypothetical protein BDN72DRAFT_849906 [Pluteus cervinus]